MLTTIIVLAMATSVCAQSSGAKYPNMAPIDQYLMSQDAEVAMARSAAPDSISKEAEVLVLDRHGYRVAAKGSNGFACVVQRSWTTTLDDPEFWNPKMRAPVCLNAPAVRSFLPRIVKRTTLVLAGKTKEQLRAELSAALDAKTIPAIEMGSMSYMQSKQGYLNDHDGHWHPHIMVFVPLTDLASWGANLPGSQVFGGSDPVDRVTTIYVPVAKWSDGSADVHGEGSH
jgi:hypothetical protein